MVQARPVLVEAVVAVGCRMLVEAQQRASREQVHRVVEAAGVLVEHRLGAKQALIPRDAYGQVGHGHRDMAHGWELGHRIRSPS
jgi:hypothetical protein